MPFTPLRVRSHGSLLYGTAAPEALLARAGELGYRALALTDRDNLYLAIRFYQAAHAAGLAPLLGAEVSDGRRSALLLALDRRGYTHLCEVLTLRHLDTAFDLVAALAPRHAGLHVIVESPGLLATLVAAGVPPAAGAAAPRRARDGGLWCGVRGLPRERAELAARLAAAHALGVPPVATGDVALLAASEFEAHRAAVTAAAGELIERMPAAAFAAPVAWLCSPAEWARRVRAACGAARMPEAAELALANNAALVARCRLTLDLGRPIFPLAPLPHGTSGPAHLAAQCAGGLERRYMPDARPAARAQLERELEIIERCGFTAYFLLVAEIVGFARARGIPTVGRGSGASSIVSYVLGITNVDPIAHGLTFERFLHPARRDCPDLDIDLCWKRREEVIAHVYDTYGDDRVATISTHATLGARSAFRETAKVLGVSNDRVNGLARRIPRDLAAPFRERLRDYPAAADVDWDEPVLRQALALAERLDGAPRHLSVHCGGIVIGDRALTHYVPLERAAKDVVVTQFEMHAIEAIGLVKMDLLGNRALSTMAECVTLVREHRGIEVAVADIPTEDALTGARIAAGDTLNGFQLESPAMRHLLRMLRCSTLAETIAAVALVRPGAAESGMKTTFCRRHRGLEPVSFRHERLRAVLGATYGVMLYEEDVMRVAAAVAGLTLAEGDDLRRALGAARDDEQFRALERGFVERCARAAVGADAALEVWRDLTRFAGYAFCKAHAAGYGTLGWQSAWLKARYPAEWAVGILNHHAGMYATWVHVEDLRRQGVEFAPPCTQRSEWNATLEAAIGAQPSGVSSHLSRGRPQTRAARMAERVEEERGGAGCGAERARERCDETLDGGARPSEANAEAGHTVRVGLARVFGLAVATGNRIVTARAERPFASLADFADRARPTLPELESLILAGALDWTGQSRPSLLLEARVGAVPLRHSVSAAHRAPVLVGGDGRGVMPDAVAPVAVPMITEFGVADRVRGEVSATGLWFSGHPLDVLVDRAALRGTVPAAEIERHAGRRVAVAGLPCASRRVETKDGGVMLFLTLADQSGLVECVLFPPAYRAFARVVRAEVVRVEGRVEAALDAISVTVERAFACGAEDHGVARQSGDRRVNR